MGKSLKTSVALAVLGGILAITLETIRRRHQMMDPHYFFNWFDDYLAGGFLLFAAWLTNKQLLKGRRFLCAAWGVANGMMYMSFFGQLQHMDIPDPSQVANPVVLSIKGAMFALSIIGLALALIPPEA